jgi:hypothetical protein
VPEESFTTSPARTLQSGKTRAAWLVEVAAATLEVRDDDE